MLDNKTHADSEPAMEWHIKPSARDRVDDKKNGAKVAQAHRDKIAPPVTLSKAPWE